MARRAVRRSRPSTATGSTADEGIEGAETRRDLGTRVYAALARVLAGEAEHHVVVTHGFALTYVVAGWIGMPLEATGPRVVPGAQREPHRASSRSAPFHNRTVTLASASPAPRPRRTAASGGPRTP